MAKLTHIDPSQNMHRFYTVQLMPTLFGTWSLLCEYGRIGSPGTLRLESFDSEDQARTAEQRTIKTRLRHGYSQAA